MVCGADDVSATRFPGCEDPFEDDPHGNLTHAPRPPRLCPGCTNALAVPLSIVWHLVSAGGRGARDSVDIRAKLRVGPSVADDMSDGSCCSNACAVSMLIEDRLDGKLKLSCVPSATGCRSGCTCMCSAPAFGCCTCTCVGVVLAEIPFAGLWSQGVAGAAGGLGPGYICET